MSCDLFKSKSITLYILVCCLIGHVLSQTVERAVACQQVGTTICYAGLQNHGGKRCNDCNLFGNSCGWCLDWGEELVNWCRSEGKYKWDIIVRDDTVFGKQDSCLEWWYD